MVRVIERKTSLTRLKQVLVRDTSKEGDRELSNPNIPFVYFAPLLPVRPILFEKFGIQDDLVSTHSPDGGASIDLRPPMSAD